MAETIGSGAVPPGSTSNLFHGYLNAAGDAMGAARKGLMAGRGQFMNEFTTLDGINSTRMEALATKGMNIDQAGATYAALRYLRAALPTSWIAGIDDAAKTFSYRAHNYMEIANQADAKGLEGADRGAYIDDATRNVSPGIHEGSKTFAEQTTFTEPLTGFAQKASEVIDKMNVPVPGTKMEIPVGRAIVPFMKVPSNFIKFLYRTSPLPLAFPTQAFKDAIAQGGASRDLAYARMGLGTQLSLPVVNMALQGYITGSGPSDPKLNAAWRAAGNQPHSIQLPGMSPVSYPIEPFARSIGAIADTVDIMKFAKNEDSDQLAASIAFGVGNSFMNTTYMQNALNLMDAMQHPDENAARFSDQLLSSMTVPNMVRDFSDTQDGWLRAHYDMASSIEGRLPWVRNNLPYQRTLWGDPIPIKDAYLPFATGTGLAHMVSKIQVGPPPENSEPIDKWIWNNRQAFQAAGSAIPGKPSRTQTWSMGSHLDSKVELDPYEYDRFQELAGNGMKDNNGLGAKDHLNALVAGNNPDKGMQNAWNNGTPAEQALQVQSVITRFRAAARNQIYAEYPDVRAAVTAGAQQRKQALTGQ